MNSVWILETTYTSGIKELNGVYETKEKALQGSDFVKRHSGEKGDAYIVESQKVTQFFVL